MGWVVSLYSLQWMPWNISDFRWTILALKANLNFNSGMQGAPGKPGECGPDGYPGEQGLMFSEHN